MKHLLVLTTAVLTFALAPPAEAGTYDVLACRSDQVDNRRGNNSWIPDSPSPAFDNVTQCPEMGIVSRLRLASDRVPYGTSTRFSFTAPPGTRIFRYQGLIQLNAARGWHAGFVDATPRWVYCGANCSTLGQYLGVDLAVDTTQLFAQVTCGDLSGCPRFAQDGFLAMRQVAVSIADYILPDVAMTGGTVVTPGWHSGDQTVSIEARDSTGVRLVELYVDNVRDSYWEPTCDFSRPRPCDDLALTQLVRSGAFQADGEHRITLRALDAGGNEKVASRRILIDQTAPSSPVATELDSDAWRPSNRFDLRWENPKQQFAPIAAVRYSLCPTSTAASSSRDCVDGRIASANISELRGLKVPRAGAWRLTLWLEDGAGNADRGRAATVSGLRFDDETPYVAFAPISANDPTRVRVSATDAVSGIAAGQIEARREGEDAWRSLRTQLEDGGFSAWLDDEVLPGGRYDLRARAVDAAGNERTTQSGDTATRTLPLRVRTQLAVGKPRRVRARNSNGKRRYRTVLQVKPSARYGRTIPLSGRLTMPGTNPLAGVDVEVWERVKLAAAEWRRIGVVRTSRTGRFRFKALRGPSRTLRFRYPGTATIRPRSAAVDLGVRAVTTFRSTRTRVVNGEEVRFHGRLKGTQTGTTGKLIYLQVFTRGRWSTFATTRASRSTGLWSVPYRFTATRGLVRYRFRVVIPKEGSFPYETGRSKSVHVTVRGL